MINYQSKQQIMVNCLADNRDHNNKEKVAVKAIRVFKLASIPDIDVGTGGHWGARAPKILQ